MYGITNKEPKIHKTVIIQNGHPRTHLILKILAYSNGSKKGLLKFRSISKATDQYLTEQNQSIFALYPELKFSKNLTGVKKELF